MIARAVTARPWLVISGWALGAAAVIALAPSLGSITTSDPAAFRPDNAESVRASELAGRAFPGADGATGVIVVRRSDAGPLTPHDGEALARLAGRLGANAPPVVGGFHVDPQQSISPNRAVGLIAIQFTAPAEDRAVRDAVAAIRAD